MGFVLRFCHNYTDLHNFTLAVFIAFIAKRLVVYLESYQGLAACALATVNGSKKLMSSVP